MNIAIRYIFKRAGLHPRGALPTFLSKQAKEVRAMEWAGELNFEEVFKVGDILSLHYDLPQEISLIHHLTDYSDHSKIGPDPSDKEKVSEELLYHIVRTCFGRPFKKQAHSVISEPFQEHLALLCDDIARQPKGEFKKDSIPTPSSRALVKKLFDVTREYFQKVESAHPHIVSQIHVPSAQPQRDYQPGGALSLRPDYGSNEAARGPASGIPRAASIKHVKEWLKAARKTGP